jgi:hypothetical protein
VEVCEEGNDKTEVQANGFDDGGGEYNPPGWWLGEWPVLKFWIFWVVCDNCD